MKWSDTYVKIGDRWIMYVQKWVKLLTNTGVNLQRFVSTIHNKIIINPFSKLKTRI